jgi:hypothetical protein
MSKALRKGVLTLPGVGGNFTKKVALKEEEKVRRDAPGEKEHLRRGKPQNTIE